MDSQCVFFFGKNDPEKKEKSEEMYFFEVLVIV
jgi:hypothetical protein